MFTYFFTIIYLDKKLFFENHIYWTNIYTRISNYANYGPLDKNCYVILVIFPEHDFLFESSSTYCGGAVCSSWRKAKSNDGYKQDVALITSQVKRTQQDNSSCHGAVACLSCLS